MKQQTLQNSFSLTGKGLHTGMDITITFLPAPENHGYKIQRIDLPEQPVIEAVADQVSETQRGTVVGKNEVVVSTIEHAMAALYGAGIDNCLIQVNAPEFPILDGSAKYYTDAIEKAGIVEQEAERDYYIIKDKIEVKDENTGSSILVLPDDHFSVNVLINFDSPVLNNQYACLEDLEQFKDEISASRTFVFVREIEPLVKHNLIKGGDLDNAIVIYDQKTSQEELDRLADLMNVPHKHVDELGYINNKPLVFDNEPARHKLLDILGDIALIGKPIKGRIIATRPGHKINNQLARSIRKEMKRQEIQARFQRGNGNGARRAESGRIRCGCDEKIGSEKPRARAVHHFFDATGIFQQAGLHGARNNEPRAAPVRRHRHGKRRPYRVHHVYENGLRTYFGGSATKRAIIHPRRVRR